MIVTQINNKIHIVPESIYIEDEKIRYIFEKRTTTSETILEFADTVDFTAVEFTIPSDGWYRIYEFKLPLESTNTPPVVSGVITSNVYYFYQSNIYRDSEIVENSELIIAPVIATNLGTAKSITDIINITDLEALYVATIKDIITQCMNNCLQDKNGIFKRDVLTMGIAIIKQLANSNKPAEAERIIESLLSCTSSSSSLSSCNCF